MVLLKKIRNNLSKKIFYIYIHVPICFFTIILFYISREKKTLYVGIPLKSDTFIRDVYITEAADVILYGAYNILLAYYKT